MKVPCANPANSSTGGLGPRHRLIYDDLSDRSMFPVIARSVLATKPVRTEAEHT